MNTTLTIILILVDYLVIGRFLAGFTYDSYYDDKWYALSWELFWPIMLSGLICINIFKGLFKIPFDVGIQMREWIDFLIEKRGRR